MAVQVVSFRCVLKNSLGRVISSTVNQNVLTEGGHSFESLAPVAAALRDLRQGDKRQVFLRAEQAFGFYQPKLVITRPLDQINMSQHVKLGDQVIYDSEGQRGVFRVTEISGDAVTLDGNHPLAGQDLVFDIEAFAAREATVEEIAQASTDTYTPVAASGPH